MWLVETLSRLFHSDFLNFVESWVSFVDTLLSPTKIGWDLLRRFHAMISRLSETCWDSAKTHWDCSDSLRLVQIFFRLGEDIVKISQDSLTCLRSVKAILRLVMITLTHFQVNNETLKLVEVFNPSSLTSWMRDYSTQFSWTQSLLCRRDFTCFMKVAIPVLHLISILFAYSWKYSMFCLLG